MGDWIQYLTNVSIVFLGVFLGASLHTWLLDRADARKKKNEAW